MHISRWNESQGELPETTTKKKSAKLNLNNTVRNVDAEEGSQWENSSNIFAHAFIHAKRKKANVRRTEKEREREKKARGWKGLRFVICWEFPFVENVRFKLKTVNSFVRIQRTMADDRITAKLWREVFGFVVVVLKTQFQTLQLW